MANRSPLNNQPRQVVQPADLYTSGQTDKPASPQVDLPTKPLDHAQDDQNVNDEVSTQNHLTTKPQVVKRTSGQVAKSTKNAKVDKTTNLQVDKYTTHLKPESIRAIKRLAFESDRKDYQIVQEAINAYIEAKGDTPPN